MPKNKLLIIENGAYFFSAKLVGGVRLFKDQAFAEIMLNSLAWYRSEGRISLFAYVVMPNHIHFLFQPAGDIKVDKIIHGFSSYTAHQIIQVCKNKGYDKELDVFSDKRHLKADRKYAVWQKSWVVTVDNDLHFREKLEYIHNNPIRKGWKLCEERGEYPFSSAGFYDKGKKLIVPIDSLSIEG